MNTSGKTIWKYPIMFMPDRKVDMPQGALLLHVGLDDGVPCIWAEVDPQKPLKQREIHIRRTGDPLQGNETVYIGSIRDGSHIWHVYE